MTVIPLVPAGTVPAVSAAAPFAGQPAAALPGRRRRPAAAGGAPDFGDVRGDLIEGVLAVEDLGYPIQQLGDLDVAFATAIDQPRRIFEGTFAHLTRERDPIDEFGPLW